MWNDEKEQTGSEEFFANLVEGLNKTVENMKQLNTVVNLQREQLNSLTETNANLFKRVLLLENMLYNKGEIDESVREDLKDMDYSFGESEPFVCKAKEYVFGESEPFVYNPE